MPKVSPVTKRSARFAQQLRRFFLQVVFPPRCQACRVILADARGRFQSEQDPVTPPLAADGPACNWLSGLVHQVLAPWLCPVCLAALEPLDGPVCTCCGQAFTSRNVPDHVCGRCIQTKRPYGMARSVLSYNDVTRLLVHRFKFHDRIQLARPLGRLLRTYFEYAWKDRPVDLVAPVPLHTRRFRQRGFNQAWLLVRDWQPSGVKTAAGTWQTARQALLRTRWNLPQTGLKAGQRADNIRGAFAAGPAPAVAGRRILLVDDVMTTGATVGECARVLTRAGAEVVDVLTLARA